MGDSKKLVSELKSSSSIVEWKFQWFCRAFAVMGLLLFWSTWKLWTPQTAYPQIPFFEFLVDVPGFVDWTALTFVVCSLIVILLAMSDRIRSIGFIGFALAAIALILLNQHRLQPWAYQFVIFAIILGVARPQIAFFWMRWIVISIYIYSAISKMDYQFVHTVGEELLCDLGYKFGIDFGPWSPDFKENWILIMPRIELFIGAGLAFQRSRRYAAIGAIALHAILVLALIGNVDGWGVLLWNLFFIDMIFLLFYSSLQAESESVVTEPRGLYPMEFLASAIAVFVMVFPLTLPLGFCDHWPAWQVYAPRTSRVTIQEDPNYSFGNMLIRQTYDSGEILGVPVYPQARFQLAVCMAVIEKQKWDRSVVLSGVSDRHTGERDSEILTGRDQMKMKASQYWLNTKPRPFYFDSIGDE